MNAQIYLGAKFLSGGPNSKNLCAIPAIGILSQFTLFFLFCGWPKICKQCNLLRETPNRSNKVIKSLGNFVDLLKFAAINLKENLFLHATWGHGGIYTRDLTGFSMKLEFIFSYALYKKKLFDESRCSGPKGNHPMYDSKVKVDFKIFFVRQNFSF